MSFWNSEKLRQRLSVDKLIKPPNPDFIKHGGYELSLGPEAFLTSEPAGTKRRLERGDQLIIPPGQFGLLLTEETVSIPSDAIAFISIRFTIKCQGLINVSGFHVDPGFTGQLKFAVFNAGSQNIPLARGDRIFIIWFSDLSSPTRDVYDGQHASQVGITSEDVRLLQGEVASPGALKKEIDELRSTNEQNLKSIEKEISIWRGITIGIIGLLFTLIIRRC